MATSYKQQTSPTPCKPASPRKSIAERAPSSARISVSMFLPAIQGGKSKTRLVAGDNIFPITEGEEEDETERAKAEHMKQYHEMHKKLDRQKEVGAIAKIWIRKNLSLFVYML